MERTLISWNLPNWITISLMAAASYALIGVITQLLKQQSGGAWTGSNSAAMGVGGM